VGILSQGSVNYARMGGLGQAYIEKRRRPRALPLGRHDKYERRR